MRSSTGFIFRSHANQRCPHRRQAASRGPRLVRYNALDFINEVVRQGAAPLWNPSCLAGEQYARHGTQKGISHALLRT